MIKDFLHNFIGFCLSLLPPNVGILSGIIAAVLTDPFEALRLLSGRSAYTPDTYKSYPNAITQLHSVLINDSHHSVLIRGCDASKPVLLILHGGPGATDIPFHRSYGQYLELDFVVVHYDQRGACKSAVLNSSLKNFAETITVEQHINDAIGVATWIIQNPLLPDAKNGIFLLGGSWGSILGQFVVAKRPDLFRKVIFRGLAWNGPMSETLSTAFITTRMKMLNYPSAIISDVAKLVYPYGSHVSNLLRQREWLTAMGGQSCEDVSSLPKPLWRLSHDVSKALCLSPEMSLRDLLSMKPNMLNCLRHMWPEVESTNMLTLVPSLEIPVLVLHGRHDNCTAHSLVEEYLNRLSAPVKKLVWFEKSGHSPQKEESAEFAMAVKHFLLGGSYAGKYPMKDF